jgi:hypothetical protein
MFITVWLRRDDAMQNTYMYTSSESMAIVRQEDVRLEHDKKNETQKIN